MALSPEALKAVLSEKDVALELHQNRIEFVVVFIKGEQAQEVSERYARIATIAVSHNALIDGFMSGLVVMVFGKPLRPEPKPDGRRSLVGALADGLPGELKIVHGASEGYRGMFGKGIPSNFSFLVPRFDDVLAALARLQFGQTLEFKY